MARWIGRATTTLGTRGGQDDATSAYLDQFARELQALWLDFKMSRGAVRIALPRGGRKSEIRRGKRWGSEGAFSRLFTRTGRTVLTRRLPLRLFMMTTMVTSGHGGSSSSGSRSSFPLGFGRPSSARTSLLMAAARNPNFVEGKRTGSSTGANRALTTQRKRVATTPPPLGVLKVLERERAPPGCANSRGVALARLNGEFRKGCRPSSRESGKIRVVPSGSSFLRIFPLKGLNTNTNVTTLRFLLKTPAILISLFFHDLHVKSPRPPREISITSVALVLKKRIEDDRCRHQSNQAASCQRSAISRVGARPR